MNHDDVRLSRKEEEKKARKNDILEAAAYLFSTRDYHEVKMDDIAQQVGLSKGTIYLYFENKEKLFYSIIYERTRSLNKRLEATIRCDDRFEVCLVNFVKTYIDFFNENEAFFKIMQTRKSLVDRDEHFEMHHQAREAYRRFMSYLVEIMERGTQQDYFRPINPLDATKMLWGMLHAFTFHHVMIASDKAMDEHEAELLVDLFLNGVKKS